MTLGKEQAHAFLRALEVKLNQRHPPPGELRGRIDAIVAEAKEDGSKRHLRGREYAFINVFVIPVIFGMLCEQPGMTQEDARHALLSESFRNVPEYSKASPARKSRHPFSKLINTDPTKIYQKWAGETEYLPLTQSCPDFAIQEPFAHKIVFEAKYFLEGSPATAQRELVANAYQAFFYLGLPQDKTGGERPDWDYDYACLLAYDTSPTGTLRDAWKRISPEVRAGFWEGANVYVMIFPGVPD